MTKYNQPHPFELDETDFRGIVLCKCGLPEYIKKLHISQCKHCHYMRGHELNCPENTTAKLPYGCPKTYEHAGCINQEHVLAEQPISIEQVSRRIFILSRAYKPNTKHNQTWLESQIANQLQHYRQETIAARDKELLGEVEKLTVEEGVIAKYFYKEVVKKSDVIDLIKRRGE